MKFGKVSDLSSVRFDFPTEPALNAKRLGIRSGKSALPVYLGCTGWSMKEWVGKVYPKGTKNSDFLARYAEQFNAIELNNTHYRVPRAETVEKWRQESTPDFRFCPKVPQQISHSRNLGLGEDTLPAFIKVIAKLEEKMGCCFVQLPPYFGADRLELLDRFLQAWPKSIPLAAEVRHGSWFDQAVTAEKLFETFYRHKTAAVITDVAGRRDVLHLQLTAPRSMIRFVGNGLHPTDYARAQDWVDRLKTWQTYALEEVFFFPHQPDNLHAPEMTAHLHGLLEKAGGFVSRGPEIRDASDQGDQLSLFG